MTLSWERGNVDHDHRRAGRKQGKPQEHQELLSPINHLVAYKLKGAINTFLYAIKRRSGNHDLQAKSGHHLFCKYSFIGAHLHPACLCVGWDCFDTTGRVE